MFTKIIVLAAIIFQDLARWMQDIIARHGRQALSTCAKTDVECIENISKKFDYVVQTCKVETTRGELISLFEFKKCIEDKMRP